MITTLRLSAIILFCCLSLHTQVIDRKLVELPPFESNEEIAYRAERGEYAEAKTDATFKYERLTYKSGDLVVSGYLYAPVKPAVKMPVILFIRGNYIVHDQAPVLLTMFHRLAQQGFIVFAPMLRGSDGTQGRDELGGADLQDVKAALELAITLPHADPDNVYLYGESRGAMMIYFSLREGWPIRAAAVYGGITDVKDYLAGNDREGKMASTIWPDFDSRKEEIYFTRSAIRWPEKIHTPILIMHGGADPQVSPMHALRMAEALTSLKREYSLTIFAGDNHHLTHNRNTRDNLAVQWFRDHKTTSTGAWLTQPNY